MHSDDAILQFFSGYNRQSSPAIIQENYSHDYCTLMLLFYTSMLQKLL